MCEKNLMFNLVEGKKTEVRYLLQITHTVSKASLQ